VAHRAIEVWLHDPDAWPHRPEDAATALAEQLEGGALEWRVRRRILTLLEARYDQIDDV
jgi:hypothetical protein